MRTLMLTAMVSYQVANLMERSGDARKLELAHYLRYAVMQVAVFLIGALNALLAQSDWTKLPDVPPATKEAWATYRQALRDITNQPDPFNIVWPTPPGG